MICLAAGIACTLLVCLLLFFFLSCGLLRAFILDTHGISAELFHQKFLVSCDFFASCVKTQWTKNWNSYLMSRVSSENSCRGTNETNIEYIWWSLKYMSIWSLLSEVGLFYSCLYLYLLFLLIFLLDGMGMLGRSTWLWWCDWTTWNFKFRKMSCFLKDLRWKFPYKRKLGDYIDENFPL